MISQVKCVIIAQCIEICLIKLEFMFPSILF